MIYLIPNDKLSYYLSKSGYLKFIDWYKTISFLEPIYNEIEDLTNIIDNSHWLEDELRTNIFIKIKNIIIKQIKNSLGKEPETIYKEWINSIQPYCFQGGIGHKIQYSNYSTNTIPHHWCVKPEYYKIILNIPETVILSSVICDKYINISEKLENQNWCN